MTALTMLSACEQGAEITQLTKINFPQTLSTTATTITLSTENDGAGVADFSWEKVAYGIEAPVTYTLQFDVPADTSGVNGWTKAA